MSWLHDLVEEVRELGVVQHRLGEIRIRGLAHGAPSDVVLPSSRLDAVARRIRLLDLAQRISTGNLIRGARLPERNPKSYSEASHCVQPYFSRGNAGDIQSRVCTNFAQNISPEERSSAVSATNFEKKPL